MRLPRPWPGAFWRLLRRRMPKSLFGRSLLIIVLPITVMQVLVTWVFFDAHWQTVNSRLTDGVAGDIAWIVQSYDAAPTAANLQRIGDLAQRTMGLSVSKEPGADLPRGRRPVLITSVDQALGRALAVHIDAPYWFDAARYPDYVDIRVKTPGGVLRIIAPKDRVFATQGHVFILWLTVATILLTGVSILFIRNQVRAIERLAEAADAFGRGVDLPFRPHGAREVRQAAQAFLAMKSRIQRHVEQRTTLLAAVSHDLRTPLTRMQLELALSEPGVRVDEMKRDVVEMEHMIDEYLAFARGEGPESVETVDVGALLGDVGEAAARSGVSVDIVSSPGLSVCVRPNALKRALTNIVLNAVGHARKIDLTARMAATGGAEIVIDDDGPGIPEALFEEAFTPFSRLGPARDAGSKGVGLGLAIARDIVRGHGGEISLARSPLGGLRARIWLPA